MVPKRLRNARLAAKLSQEKLAQMIDVDAVNSRSQISNYEGGRFTPAFEFIARVAHALDYPTAYFYTEDDDFAERVLLLHRNRHNPDYNPYYFQSQSINLTAKITELEKGLAEAKELAARLSKCLNTL